MIMVWYPSLLSLFFAFSITPLRPREKQRKSVKERKKKFGLVYTSNETLCPESLHVPTSKTLSFHINPTRCALLVFLSPLYQGLLAHFFPVSQQNSRFCDG